MTSAIYDHFMQNDYIKGILSRGGSVSPNEIGSYGTIIISKFKCHYYECDFVSQMSRKLKQADFCCKLILAAS